MNFFHFEGAEMTLRHVTLSGVTGATRLGDMLQDIWTPDVKSNQLADVISGVSPIRSVVNVGSGVADLILLPIEQYRKDGRIARGVQRGTNSFVRSTAMEMMKLGARLATGTQVVLERAEGVLGAKVGDSVVLETTAGDEASDDEGMAQQSRYRNQPSDVREGVKAAYASLSTNMNSAAQTILAVPMEVYERSGDDVSLVWFWGCVLLCCVVLGGPSAGRVPWPLARHVFVLGPRLDSSMSHFGLISRGGKERR